MTTPRTYSADDVAKIVELFRASGDLPKAELAGMVKLADVLKHYEDMSANDIEREVTQYLRSLRSVNP